MNSLKDDGKALLRAFGWYSRRKTIYFSNRFEGFKNYSVELLMHRRGALQKRFWHGSMVGLASVGLLTSGLFGGQNIVSSSFPGVGGADPRFADSFEPFPAGPILAQQQDTHTNISQKPRSEIIDYKVQSGDTLSGIAQKFGITAETIQWANNIDDVSSIKPSQTLKILPVSGVTHTVQSGDTLQSIAKKYQADAQAILDFPFNDIPDDFQLKSGQILIIPDGEPPETKVPAKKKAPVQPQYIAQGPSSPVFEAPGGANFVWPTRSVGISQYFSWYHPGVDLPNPAQPPVAAADSGMVIVAGWPDSYGYGNRVVINHGNGYQSLYAHLSNIYVSIGQTVSRGQVIGQMGSTGRSTGSHLHFEIHYHGVSINPLSILK